LAILPLYEADQLADQIAILHEGNIVAEGTVAELKKLLPQGHIELGFRDKNEVQLSEERGINRKSQL
jgi:ABC-2 type transport system ATP-binding protein